MTKATARRLSPYAMGMTILTFAALLSAILLNTNTPRAGASHPGDSALSITQELATGQVPTTVDSGATVTVNLGSATATTGAVLINGEYENGLNDPDASASHGTPDTGCTIPAAATSCEMPLRTGVLNATGEIVRVWIDDDSFDSVEGANHTTAPGCTAEPNKTAVFSQVTTAATPGSTPSPTPLPPTGRDPTPTDACATPSPSPSSPSPTDSSPSPSPSSPSPSPSSPSPSPTGTSPSPPPTGTSPTPSPTGTGIGSMTIAVNPTVGVYGTDFVVSGVVRCSGAGVPNTEVVIGYSYIVPPPQPIFLVATDSDANGNYSVTLRDLVSSSVIAAFWDGNNNCPDGAESDDVIARVRAGIAFNMSPSSGGTNTFLNFCGYVLPGHPGKWVAAQVFRGTTGQWDFIGRRVFLNSDSRYCIRYRKGTPGRLLIRVVYPTQDSDHLWNVSRAQMNQAG